MSWMTITNYLVEHWLEITGVVTTFLGIGLTSWRKLACWPVILVSDVIYLDVFYRTRLYSDALLQVFFLAFTLYGWWYWWRSAREEGEVRVVQLKWSLMLAGLAVGALGSLIFGHMAKQVHAALPYLDATLASYSLVATWWQARKHIANWWLWIVVDLVYIGEYIYKDLWPTAILYAGLVVLAVMGLLLWWRAARKVEALQTAA
jgi:nicotinamide mononucleotide transporter